MTDEAALSAVLENLIARQPRWLTADEIASNTCMSPTGVSNLLVWLTKRNLVLKRKRKTKTVFQFNPASMEQYGVTNI